VQIRQPWALGALAAMLLAGRALAGPCSDDIYQADLSIENRLDSAAASGKTAPESTAATLHRQPTPGSIAAAEGKLGDLSDQDVIAMTEEMDKARDADMAGNRAACLKALAEVRRILSR
jgi:hypothetical protein